MFRVWACVVGYVVGFIFSFRLGFGVMLLGFFGIWFGFGMGSGEVEDIFESVFVFKF